MYEIIFDHVTVKHGDGELVIGDCFCSHMIWAEFRLWPNYQLSYYCKAGSTVLYFGLDLIA